MQSYTNRRSVSLYIYIYICICIYGRLCTYSGSKPCLTRTKNYRYSQLIYIRLLAPLFQKPYETHHIIYVPCMSTLWHWHGIKSLLTPVFNQRKSPPINFPRGFSFENLIVTHRYMFWRRQKILIALKQKNGHFGTKCFFFG